MFDFKSNPHDVNLNQAITSLFTAMSSMEEGDDQYSNAADDLVKLLKLKNETTKLEYEISLEADKLRNETEKIALDSEKLKFEQEKHNSWRPSPDAIVAVVGTIATALLVLNFEKIGVISSKAFTFIGKTMK